MSTPLLENILNQAVALRQVARYQSAEGRLALNRAAAQLKSKERIVLSGMGASLFACIPFEYALARHGIQVSTVETSELLYYLAPTVDEGTAVVLVSRSGESVEVIKLLNLLRGRGVSVIGLANVPETALALASNYPIVLGSPADQLVAIQTYTGTLAVFALLAAVLLGEWNEAMTELEEAADVLSRWIPECVSASEQWKAFLSSGRPMYLLGRGPSLGAVFEGSLLMHETAKLPAVGLSAAQFRHGPVEVTDEDFRGIIIGTRQVTSKLDAALGEDLAKMGGQVRWVGPAESDSSVPPLVAWPDGVPERFVSLVEVIPLQMAAYRAAEWRGIRPGDFRWAPLVTRSETGFSIPG